MNAFGKFRSLNRSDQRLLLQTWCLVGSVRVWLWLFTWRSLQRFLQHMARKTADASRISSRYPERAAWAVKVAARRFPGARTCLVEAMALQFILVRHHFPAELKIGVCRDEADKVRAHAWVECSGRVVIGETDLDRYTVLTAPRNTVQ